MVDVSNLHDSWNQCSVAMVWCLVCYGWFEPYWNQSVYLYVKDCCSFSILLYMDEQKKWCCEWHSKLREKKDDIRLVSIGEEACQHHTSYLIHISFSGRCIVPSARMFAPSCPLCSLVINFLLYMTLFFLVMTPSVILSTGLQARSSTWSVSHAQFIGPWGWDDAALEANYLSTLECYACHVVKLHQWFAIYHCSYSVAWHWAWQIS